MDAARVIRSCEENEWTDPGVISLIPPMGQSLKPSGVMTLASGQPTRSNGSAIVPQPALTPGLPHQRNQNPPDASIESALKRINELYRIAKIRHDRSFIRRLFETGEYPYQMKMRTDLYEDRMRKLQCELMKCERLIVETGQKIVVLFEGRDAVGKGSTIKRFMEHMSPRTARVVALVMPTQRERTQWYFQRFIVHLPAAGEICLFDRSWYNRATVERVMGYCSDMEYLEFMRQCPIFEQMLTRSGIQLFKYWLSVSREEQACRIKEREIDPLKQWKLSANDRLAIERWDEYTDAKQEIFYRTDTTSVPWIIIKSDDKKRARVNCMLHFLSSLPYPDKNPTIVTGADPLIVGMADYVVGRTQQV